jgi:DNA-binding IscR family transcriptional regulator
MNETETHPSQNFQEELAKKVLADPGLKSLTHLPFLTLFYLHFQRNLVMTPVTALELAAYLGVDVKVSEGVLVYLKDQGIVREFKRDLPAYTLQKDLHELTVLELLPLLSRFSELLQGPDAVSTHIQVAETDERYRKIYSELASEILQLFGKQPVNELPI